MNELPDVTWDAVSAETITHAIVYKESWRKDWRWLWLRRRRTTEIVAAWEEAA